MDSLDSKVSELRKLQLQYIYYVIALSVAGIGFAIHNTTEQRLETHHIFLGLGIIFWGLSIHSGFIYIKKYLSILAGNIEYFGLINKDSDSANRIKNDVMKEVSTTPRVFKLQQVYFYLGTIAYIGWHVFKMYSLR